jgi:Uma2 family endonuclease
MTPTAARANPPPVLYPESDGKPLAENTKQLRWIVVLYGNLCALFSAQPDVFVASDLFWYPREGEPGVRTAPDVLVVFGRPKGDRGSYRQWEEDDLPVTVAFEVLSPGNDYWEMADKRAFYEEHGVEEYYVYDPDRNRLEAFVRQGEVFRRLHPGDGFASPRLGIRFDLSGPEMQVFHPDGQRFLSFEEVRAEYERERRQRLDAEQRLAVAQNQLNVAEQGLTHARGVLTRIADLSRKARQQQATPGELAELERLEEEAT